MNLSLAFDYVSRALIIAELVALGPDETALKLISSYLKDWKQCVRMNDKYSNFKDIISGAWHGTTVGPIFSTNQSVTFFFFFFESFTILSFADDNTVCIGQYSF